MNNYNTYHHTRSECFSEPDLLEQFEEPISDFSDEEDRQMMLDFIHLRPTEGQEVGGTFQPRTNRRLTEVEVETDPIAFEIEYENCQNRSTCGKEDECDKDIGLDSTLSISVKSSKRNRSNRTYSLANSPSKAEGLPAFKETALS